MNENMLSMVGGDARRSSATNDDSSARWFTTLSARRRRINYKSGVLQMRRRSIKWENGVQLLNGGILPALQRLRRTKKMQKSWHPHQSAQREEKAHTQRARRRSGPKQNKSQRDAFLA